MQAVARSDPSVLETGIRGKVTIAKQGGGYVFSSDHSIPEDAPLKPYQQTSTQRLSCNGGQCSP